MPGSFEPTPFRNVDVDDEFFNSLKEDYPEFASWYARKGKEGASALVYSDAEGLGAFVYLKEENERLPLVDKELPAGPRVPQLSLPIVHETCCFCREEAG